MTSAKAQRFVTELILILTLWPISVFGINIIYPGPIRAIPSPSFPISSTNTSYMSPIVTRASEGGEMIDGERDSLGGLFSLGDFGKNKTR